MYLYLFEHSDVGKSATPPSSEDLQSVEDGYLDIIDISDPAHPKLGVWDEVQACIKWVNIESINNDSPTGNAMDWGEDDDGNLIEVTR